MVSSFWELESLFAKNGNPDSQQALEHARAAFAAALEERPPYGAPPDWAQSSMGLADVLLSLATREGGISRLKEAIDLYGAVLAADRNGQSRLTSEAQERLANAKALLAWRWKQSGGAVPRC